MLMPALSVTLIALIVAAVLIRNRRPRLRPLLGALVGAWAGFALGALLGVAVDVLTANGYFLALVGHLAAIPGAVLGIRRAAPALTA
ncbi:hypothetical protein [Streptomyces sp. HNM0574]|uniref:hypothetical protein n=1 Tax=Streptomyces sp. HNM0574 TaxID=2714954 RepID=UPI00146CC3E0|nr:hypothetical protein [Streptomyces sp. HNM0574]NLU69926.1 hypothetical protein [Streptomyces sp. HNM0574]